MGYIYKLFNCPSRVKIKLSKKDRLSELLNNPISKTFMSFLSSNIKSHLQQENTGITFEGPGTIEVTGQETSFLSNTDSTILNLNLVGLIPYSSEVSMDTSEYNLIQDNDSYNNSGSIFRRAHIITSDYTLTQFDGAVFLVDASKGNIIITIPIGDVSNNRLMEFKRIDTSSNTVIITSPGGIDSYRVFKLDTKKCKDGCKSKRLPYVRLFGDGNKLWILG